MTDHRHARQPDPMDEVNRYWDALLEGGEPQQLVRTAQLDPDLAATIASLQALGAAPPPRVDFVRQLRADLFGTAANAGGEESPAIVQPNGRSPADLLSSSSPRPRDRAAQWSRPWAIAQVSTAALLVLILGSVVLVLHSRQAATPALPPVSLHAPLGQPEIAITTLVDATVPDLPAGSARVWVERWRFQPGPEAFNQQPLPEPHVIAVETGRLALLLNGQEQIINEGDQIIVPAKQSVELRNAGQTEAVAILVTFPSRQTITPRWNPLAITGEEAVPPFAFDLPGGPIHVRVERQVLPPGGALAPEVATEDVRFGAVDTGLLLTLEGTSLPVGWRAGKERVLLPQWAPPIAPGTVLTFRNGADVPVALYRVSLAPVRPE